MSQYAPLNTASTIFRCSGLVQDTFSRQQPGQELLCHHDRLFQQNNLGLQIVPCKIEIICGIKSNSKVTAALTREIFTVNTSLLWYEAKQIHLIIHQTLVHMIWMKTSCWCTHGCTHTVVPVTPQHSGGQRDNRCHLFRLNREEKLVGKEEVLPASLPYN